MSTTKTQKQTRTRTAIEQIQTALREKGYRALSRYGTSPGRPIIAFQLYTNGNHVLILQEYEDGGCELYRTVSDKLGIQDTIDKIP